MAVTILGIIQHRRGLKTDLPIKLEEGELGWCVDTRELFIGNTQATGGNTQIFTDAVDVIARTQYQFVSDTQVPSQTGTSMNQPVVRTLQQQLDDAWVNVKAYGAKGDGITDDTVAINRAIEDLYTKQLTSQEHVSQARKTIWFPSGEYVTSQPILVYPQVTLRGESCQNTKILSRNTLVTPDHVLELVDSLGQTRLNMGINGAQLPVQIQVVDLTIASSENHDLVWLSRYQNVRFKNCVFEGVWSPGDPVVPGSYSVAVRAESLGSLITSEQLHFSNCVFKNIELAFYSDDPVRVTTFHQCEFTKLHKAILTENRQAPDPDPSSGPSYTSVGQSSFVDVDSHAIQVMSDNPGVVSMMNVYVNVGTQAVVVPMLWSAVSTKCVSMADTFDTLTTVTDLGTNNLINNA
jgi:hypothetical protein